MPKGGATKANASSERMNGKDKNGPSKVKSNGKGDNDAVSIASSLSSIPLIQLKKEYLAKLQRSTSAPLRKKAKTASGKPAAVQSLATKTSKAKPKDKKLNNTAAVAVAGSKTPNSSKPQNKKRTTKAPVKASPSTTKQTTTNSGTADKESSSSDSDDEEEEEAACCLCHCGVDCSDRALFFPMDRQKELDEQDGDYYFQMDDPYLPLEVYDRNNALVYCDSCNRLYHQKCHFVPLLIIPRGDWNCLLCTLRKNNPAAATHEPWKKFANPAISKLLFTSTPPLVVSQNVQELEQEFELATATVKAQLWSRQLHQLQTFLKSQAGNIRMAQAALETLTSTKRNRAHFLISGKQSQELAQTLVRLTGAKFKIRTALQSLESIRLAANVLPQSLLEWAKTIHNPTHVQHVFPHGMDVYEHRKRIIPRTREMMHRNNESPPAAVATSAQKTESGNTVNAVPIEISVPASTSPATSNMMKPPNSPRSPRSKLKAIKVLAAAADKDDNVESKLNGATFNDKKTKHGDDDDSGITLDDLKCCVCFFGDATDENDVLLCDGAGCCRAFHMKCVVPQVQPKDIENEDEDWFCPLCRAISHLMAQVQEACMDEEDWERRHGKKGKKRHEEQGEETNSVQSWGHVDEVFPESEWEFNTSMKLKVGKQSEDTAELLRTYLGDDFFQQDGAGAGGAGTIPMPVGSDSEDENDYSLFDEESFEQRRRREREGSGGSKHGEGQSDNDSDDDGEEEDSSDSESTRSSQATLVEMSSVELNIGKSELAALSDGGASSSEDESFNEDGSPQRRSRRLRNRSTTHASAQTSLVDGNAADFDEANIIEGKRRRKAVDYRKLNDALFGDLSEKEKAKLDDKDDYQLEDTATRRNKTSSGSKRKKGAARGAKSSGKKAKSDK